MIIPRLKLKNQLTLINAFSKVLIISISIFIIPWLVNRMSIREIDNQLIDKLDMIYSVIEESGVEAYVNTEEGLQAFGSYNIFKEEYISIEKTSDTVLYEAIESSKRSVEGEILDYRVVSASIEYNSTYYLIEIGKSITSILAIEKYLKRFAFYFLLVLLSLTVLLDLSITQYLLKPFGGIIERLKSSNHPKNFDYSPVQTSTSDFKYLEESIHGLMKKLDTVFNDERDYISNISHELLTPISIIRTKLENFVNTSKLSDDEMMKIIESKVTLGRLTKLIRTLLLLSRIDNEEYVLVDKVNLVEVLESVADEFKEYFEVNNLGFSFKTQSQNYDVHANRDLLHILFFNLLNNAIKYTPPGGHVDIELYSEDNVPLVKIQDNGIGIKEEDIGHIFKRFKKFQHGDSNFGLGLALVKRIADYHGFLIEVKSVVNKGTQFVIRLK